MSGSAGTRFYVATALLGILLRLMLMPFSLHVDPRFGGDLLATNWAAYSFLHDPDFQGAPYPPLALGTIGFFLSVWPSPVSQAFSSPPEFQIQTLSTSGAFALLFVSKTLYLVFDLATALIWIWIFRNEPRKRRLAWLFWIFNPLVIYSAYMHGQFDLLPTFFLVLSLYFARRGKLRWTAFWLGIAGCYKSFPLLFLLPLVVVFAESWREGIVLAFLGAAPYTLLISPFLGQYYTSVSSYPNRYFRAGYDLGFGAQVYFFLAFYALVLWYLHYSKRRTFERFWSACLAILLVYYQFSYFDLHYWVWAVPIAALYWVERPREAKLFYFVIGLCLLVLIAPAPLARFLAPISPRFFLRLPSLMEALNRWLPMMFVVNAVRSILAGTCFYLAWHLLRGMPPMRRELSRATSGTAVVP